MFASAVTGTAPWPRQPLQADLTQLHTTKNTSCSVWVVAPTATHAVVPPAENTSSCRRQQQHRTECCSKYLHPIQHGTWRGITHMCSYTCSTTHVQHNTTGCKTLTYREKPYMVMDARCIHHRQLLDTQWACVCDVSRVHHTTLPATRCATMPHTRALTHQNCTTSPAVHMPGLCCQNPTPTTLHYTGLHLPPPQNPKTPSASPAPLPTPSSPLSPAQC